MTLETPHTVLDYWIGEAANDPEVMATKNRLWFVKSFETDTEIATRFIDTMAALASGLALKWADEGPQERLAAIITLDQFSRNIFRNMPDAFANDRLALGLTKEGLLKGDDTKLTEVERWFFYLPLEHSESAVNQDLSIRMYEKLAAEARPEFSSTMASALDYARQHKAVIDQFGRYPHRNAILGRPSTPEEQTYIDEPGSGF
ncbi:MAG: DUF924 family protein [Hyphomonadaceae bacterium]